MLLGLCILILLSMFVCFVSNLSADIQQKDREVLELLQERVTLFSDLAEVTGSCEVPLPINTRNLFRANTAQAPRAEKLLLDAIAEGMRTLKCLDGDLTVQVVFLRMTHRLLL